MKVKLTLVRPGGPSSDIVVTTDSAATIGDIARAIELADPLASQEVRSLNIIRTLSVGGGAVGRRRVLEPELAIGESNLGSGAVITIADASQGAATSTSQPSAAAAAAIVTVVDGPDKGKQFFLLPGTRYIGRGARSEVWLTDPLVSTTHARLDVSVNSLRIVDLNSANGILLDGEAVNRVELESGQCLLLGDSVLRFTVGSSAPRAEGADEALLVDFNRSPVVVERYPGTEYPAPALPAEQPSQPFPWLVMVAPLVLGVALFAITRSAQSLLFVALSPLLMVGNYFSNRANRRRRQRLDIAKFMSSLGVLRDTLEHERVLEREVRVKEYPSTAEVAAAAAQFGPLLWSRRPEHWSFLSLRLGLGELPSRNTVKVSGEETALPEYLEKLNELITSHAKIDGVPIPENLFQSGALGVAGPPAVSSGVARSLIVQLAALHSPTELITAAITSGPDTVDFEWLKWLPHTGSSASPIAGVHLANNATSGGGLLSALEEVIQLRTIDFEDGGARAAADFADSAVAAGARVGVEAAGVQPPPSATPAILVLVTDDAPVDRARLVQAAERGANAGVYILWLAPSVAMLPAASRTYVDVASGGGGGRAGYVRLGMSLAPIQLESLTVDQATAFAKQLAPVVDSSAITVDSSDLPRSVSLLSLLDPTMATSIGPVVERWKQNESVIDRTAGAPIRPRRPARLRAIVGQSGVDAMHLDLRSQGPHALVGGTTGSGKSEFLQAWVLGMAVEYSPDRVTFLFVDYKGGSAFADCVNLPHTVGLVTDLSPHLVRRALTSLRAELRYREHLLNRKKAKDLLELERRGDPESPPALVLVIDEFAALVGEVPEFVDGVVDIAQRGRSLGLHLIMATQRPAGVIKDNLRANTNLRVALRMADADDSSDVVGDRSASAFDPSIPGRAVAKTGPGRLTSFQSGYAGGWTSEKPTPPAVEITELRFGSDVIWEAPETDIDSDSDLEQGPTDQARLVKSIAGAAKSIGIPEPRRPWLDELPRAFDLTKLSQRTDSRLLLGVADVPASQLQHEVYFEPDNDGSIAIFGTGGSGKSVVLRTLAAAASITPRGGPVDVYGIDFGNAGLRMLDVLPHVGSIVNGDDPERVIRLLKLIRSKLEARAAMYAEVNAGSISDYRRLALKPDEARILLLVDGFPSFRQEFETTAGRATWFGVFQQIVAEGRQFGIHVALTADRSSSIPSSMTSSIQRRVVLRMAEDAAYAMLDAPTDVLSTKSPPGRALVDDLETQIAIIGGEADVAAQAKATVSLANAMRRSGRAAVAPIGMLPREFLQSGLPADIFGEPVLGISDEDLEPIGFVSTGAFLVSGPPGSGRSNALLALSTGLQRAIPKAHRYYLGASRSALPSALEWEATATTIEDVADLAKDIVAAIAESKVKIIVVVEGLSDFLSSAADAPLVEMIKAIKRSDNLVIAEAEGGSWGSSWPLLAEIKNARTGLLLQPESMDGELILKTPLSRVTRSEFPPGRGFYVTRGRVVRVQLPMA